ncbi:hypothetical protein MTR_8g076270 [Medicago truncatula]|uniref:Uncharacterized protein n=1 Tax=Medicago truncatula TaxID=3880 RepID=G7LD04_MEDTR|nr:hypothetical protein MTR_8g076270 [Medicago truncatula]
MGVFGLQNSKYWTEQYKIEQYNKRQNSMATKPIPVVTRPKQTQFDGFSPF